MSDGSRSIVNWMRAKARSIVLRQRGDEQRLGQPGHALQQQVPAGEQRDQQPLDDDVLADDDRADALAHVLDELNGGIHGRPE